jgi:transcriptional regulator with XRE-family HTH domain
MGSNRSRRLFSAYFERWIMTTRTPNRTLRAQWLGLYLRQLREQRRLSLDAAAEMLGRDRSALGRYERAEWLIQRPDVEHLLNIYGFYNAEVREELLAIASEIWRTDRWDQNDGEVPRAKFIDLPWLESRAERICSYHAVLVPGLFQLPEYAELVMRCIDGPEAPEEQIQRSLDRRLRRQELLTQDGRPYIEAIIDESALRRQIGSPELQRAQLDHLGRIARLPRLDIRVLPSSIALHPGLDGSFWLFQMPRPYPPVAYLDNRASRLFLESPKSEGFQNAYDRLARAAFKPAESIDLIATIREELP